MHDAYSNRTTKGQQLLYKAFAEQGHGDVSQAMLFGNVIHPPLISTEIHQHLAPLHLHILLGTTKKAIDIVTNMCRKHDAAVKQIMGDTGTSVSLTERQMITSMRAATRNIETYDAAIGMCQQYQQQVKKRSPEWHQYERAVFDNKKLKKEEQQLLSALKEEWDANAGPFIRLLDTTITSLKVKRQRYHGGAFVGNDCIRLLDGAKLLASVLMSRKFTSASDGKEYTIGSNDESTLILKLLTHLSKLHQLYSAARPLCRHEVSIMYVYVCILHMLDNVFMFHFMCMFSDLTCSRFMSCPLYHVFCFPFPSSGC